MVKSNKRITIIFLKTVFGTHPHIAIAILYDTADNIAGQSVCRCEMPEYIRIIFLSGNYIVTGYNEKKATQYFGIA
jgi:hypothetical protein